MSPPRCPRAGMFRLFSQVFTSGAKLPRVTASGYTAPKSQCGAVSPPVTGLSERPMKPRAMQASRGILLRK